MSGTSTLLTLTGIAVCILAVVYFLVPTEAERLIRQAEVALDQQQFGKARQLALQALQYDSSQSRAMLLIGLASAAQGKSAEALGYLSLVPDDGGVDALLSLEARGWLLYGAGKFSEAEFTLREVLARDPEHISAREKLIFILQLYTFV